MHAQTEFNLSAGFAKSDALLAKRATANALKRDTKAVNDALYGMGRTYHENVGRNRWLSLTWYKMESGTL